MVLRSVMPAGSRPGGTASVTRIWVRPDFLLLCDKANYMRSIFWTVGLLILSNTFMTMAWYGHLRFFGKNSPWHPSMFAIILISWGIAFFEYCFQVPANRFGAEHFTISQLKVIQEFITMIVFAGFVV